MIRLTRDNVEFEVESALDRLFEKLDAIAQETGTKPSEVVRLLDEVSWALGDDYREWFEIGDYEYV